MQGRVGIEDGWEKHRGQWTSFAMSAAHCVVECCTVWWSAAHCVLKCCTVWCCTVWWSAAHCVVECCSLCGGVLHCGGRCSLCGGVLHCVEGAAHCVVECCKVWAHVIESVVRLMAIGVTCKGGSSAGRVQNGSVHKEAASVLAAVAPSLNPQPLPTLIAPTLVSRVNHICLSQ